MQFHQETWKYTHVPVSTTIILNITRFELKLYAAVVYAGDINKWPDGLYILVHFRLFSCLHFVLEILL